MSPPHDDDHHHTLALVTIGQSPRHDYAADLPALLPPRTRLVQHGALDALSLAEVRARLSPAVAAAAAAAAAAADDDDDDDVSSSGNRKEMMEQQQRQMLVSRMRDGTEVKMDARRLEPLVEACVRRVAAAAAASATTAATTTTTTTTTITRDAGGCDESVDAILLLCTGDVPRFEDLDVPVVAPQEAVRRFLEQRGEEGVAEGRGVPRLVLVSPEGRQVRPARRRWEGVGGYEVVGAGAASPYGDGSAGEVRRVAEWVRGLVGEGDGRGRVLVYLDCMGYTLEHKRIVEGVVGAGVEVVVPREVVFRAVGRLFGEET